MSLAEKSCPPDEDIPADSSVEMSWKVFAGGAEKAYWALLLMRARQDKVPLERDRLNRYFRLHLHRGISYLNGSDSTKSIAELARLAISRRGDTGLRANEEHVGRE
jgi:DNA sulfur modification protein DndE